MKYENTFACGNPEREDKSLTQKPDAHTPTEHREAFYGYLRITYYSSSVHVNKNKGMRRRTPSSFYSAFSAEKRERRDRLEHSTH